MKTIIINSKKHGKKEVFVDDEDFEYLNQFKWYAQKSRNTFYAERRVRISNKNNGNKTRPIKMHRLIKNMDSSNQFVIDHANGNGLDNQKSNLRIATFSQNSRNSNSFGVSKYRGVARMTRNRNGKKSIWWQSTITLNKRQTYLASFPFTDEGEINAAICYNNAAKLHYGEFAKLNTI